MTLALHYLRQLKQSYRQHTARKRLQRMVDERRESFQIQDFSRRRQAMLKVTRPEPVQ